jgi:hypothetical protein
VIYRVGIIKWLLSAFLLSQVSIKLFLGYKSFFISRSRHYSTSNFYFLDPNLLPNRCSFLPGNYKRAILDVMDNPVHTLHVRDAFV